MGLLYPFPVDTSEEDFFSQNKITDDKGNKLIINELKSYGLPMIFWGYLLAFLIVWVAMMFLIKAPLGKMLEAEELVDRLLAMGTYLILFLIPFVSLCFFFYQKIIRLLFTVDTGIKKIEIIHYLFFIPLWKQTFEIKETNIFVRHFLDSPNMARLQNKGGDLGYQNRGYFELILGIEDQSASRKKEIRIDRHSQKLELEKVKKLLLTSSLN